jgi:nitrile hydratase accessory protein
MSRSFDELIRVRGIDPRDATFDEPWEARVFALALDLAERGTLRWEEFRQRLIAEIVQTDAAAAAGRPASAYYECWLAALEAALAAHGLASSTEIDWRAQQIAANPPLRNRALSPGPLKIA